MKRYFFHLDECGVVADDDVGHSLSCLEEAREKGVAAARDIMSADVRQGKLCLDAYILIEESGAEVARVHFKKALEITG